ncbi:DUF222 domain-containing protein, partial [Frankia canadensis]|uniref:DUF222 domain-containing protein n=1 Tax=Frankia canadensis TaxID=1836972 RepID=UPI000E1F011E
MASRLAVICEQIEGLLTDAAWKLSDGDLDALLEGIGRLGGPVAAVNNRLITEAVDRNLAPRLGATDIGSLLRDRLALTGREARRQVSLAQAVADGPCQATGEALADGEITVEHAHVIRAALAALPKDVTPDERTRAEQTLLHNARAFDAYALVKLAARIREHLTRVDTSPGGDPDADNHRGRPGDPSDDDNPSSPGSHAKGDDGGGDNQSDASAEADTDTDTGTDGNGTCGLGHGDEDQRPSPDPAAIRRLSLIDTPEGTTLVSGELDAEGAALLRTALDRLPGAHRHPGPLHLTGHRGLTGRRCPSGH